ncbi:DJ-1/PfpI family protein [Archangium violaceum]|uniref:DJ-1/PfpI family protein n=1 Tax=Archangium violaceum TaxID=83451 RepID=UPI001EF4B8A2|nr:DJ-1/PfpI family protein [Archangium violaceum]
MSQQSKKLQVGILVCPGFAIVDTIGIHSVFGFIPDTEVHLLWKDKELIEAIPRFPVHATTTFRESPKDFDVLCVGACPNEILRDEETLAFLKDRGSRAGYLVGVCSGSLVLGAAGLLEGYRATSNFHVMDLLPHFGAIPTRENVVIDRNRYTSGPATGGFDCGLRVLEKLRGEEVAKLSELSMEYTAQPPFGTGSPELAGPELTRKALQLFAHFTEETRRTVRDLPLRRAGAGGSEKGR